MLYRVTGCIEPCCFVWYRGVLVTSLRPVTIPTNFPHVFVWKRTTHFIRELPSRFPLPSKARNTAAFAKLRKFFSRKRSRIDNSGGDFGSSHLFQDDRPGRGLNLDGSPTYHPLRDYRALHCRGSIPTRNRAAAASFKICKELFSLHEPQGLRSVFASRESVNKKNRFRDKSKL